MFKIEAIIRTQKLESVQEALEQMHISGITVSDVRGIGRQKGITHTYRGSQYTLNLMPRTKIEVVVLPEELEEALQVIQEAATTGEIGDGKIFVIPVAQVIRIRTGEKGETALK
ncbi:MAG TPA: P-II family nitrogen regulator [Fimbriimonas sp.]|nr:P-II family nitrogen regulator [Fimbriimonas sp.]